MKLAQLQRSTLAKNTAWVLSSQVLSFGSQGAYFILLARLLGSAQYGIFIGAAALVAVFSSFSSLGSGMLLLRYVSADPKRFPEYWGNAIISTLLSGSIIMAAVALAGSQLLRSDARGMLIMIAFGECICAALAGCAGQAFQAFERLSVTAVLNSLVSVARLITVSALWISYRHVAAVTWAAASLCVSVFAVLAAVMMVSIKLGAPRFRPSLLLERLAEGFGFSVAFSATSIYNDVDKAMLNRYAMYAANGTYSVAYRIIDFACVPIRSLHAAAMPRFFRVGAGATQSNSALAKRLLKRTLPYGLGIGVVLFSAAPLVRILVGDGFAASVPALRWLCLIPALRTLHISAGDAITGAGYQRLRTGAQFGAAGLNLCLNLYFIPRWSWLGAAWTSLMTDGTLAIVSWAILLFLVRQPAKQVLAQTQEATAA